MNFASLLIVTLVHVSHHFIISLITAFTTHHSFSLPLQAEIASLPDPFHCSLVSQVRRRFRSRVLTEAGF